MTLPDRNTSLPSKDGAQEERAEKKKKFLIFGLCAVFISLGIVFFLWWLFWGQFEEITEDAYVHGNMIEVTPQVAGIVASIHIDDTFLVQEGDTLIELDRTDPKLFFDQSKTKLAETVRNVAKMFENVNEYKSDIEVRKAELIKTQQDYEHRIRLVGLGGVSKENFEHAQAAFFAALGNLEAAKARYQGALALVQNTTILTHPLVEQAKDHVKEMYVALKRCYISSPAAGIVALRKVQIGESVSVNDPLLAIIPLDQIWVNANFKENHLKNIRIGQPVELRADLYGREIIYRGTVIGIAGGTGSVFSVLPPQNATGNWIKIVQRLPVRIALDKDQIKHYPLRLGLSMHVKVDTHDRKGSVIPPLKPNKPLYSTDIYAKQIEGVNAIIDQIISQNLPSNEDLSKTDDLQQK